MTKRLLALVSLATLAGCAAVGPTYSPPITSTAATFANPIAPSQEPSVEFWKRFNDATLNQLIDDALKANTDVRIAMANLREARANRQSIDVGSLPGIGASASAQRSVNPQTQAPGSRSERTGNSLSAGVDANWELNFFGRVDRARDEAVANVDAAEAGIAAAQVIVTGEIARNYFELRGLQNQLALLQAAIRNQEETVKIVEARLEGGRGTALDTARASALLASTRAGVPALEAAIGRAAYRIAVLCGKQPQATQSLVASPQSLPALAPIDGIGTPETLLRRRPDIRIAERQIAASIARVGYTHTDLFPKVNINGLLGLNAATLSGLVEGAAFRYSLGASIVYNLFDFGLVRTRIAAADARADAALVSYEKTVLLALEETENALLQYSRNAKQTEALFLATKNSEQAAKLARIRFDAGYTDFLAVLDAERQLITDQDRFAQSQTASATSLIAIYKALGGGWVAQPR
jgi:outer membrane protein, multidrug efflux system